MLAWASAENKSHIRLLADVGFLFGEADSLRE
jgi:hypothetical protein